MQVVCFCGLNDCILRLLKALLVFLSILAGEVHVEYSAGAQGYRCGLQALEIAV